MISDFVSHGTRILAKKISVYKSSCMKYCTICASSGIKYGTNGVDKK